VEVQALNLSPIERDLSVDKCPMQAVIELKYIDIIHSFFLSLIKTPIFEWHVLWHGFKKGQQKDISLKYNKILDCMFKV
jgi:hypothetical protein